MKNLLLIILFLISQTFSSNLIAQVKHYKGSWTKVNTTYEFEFDLILKHCEGDQVVGHFNWNVIAYDEKNSNSKAYYENRIGSTAKEFVKGTYQNSTGEYFLQGYKKEDPNSIIDIDTYKLKVDKDGNIGGTTRAGGMWQGRINGKQLEFHVL